MASATDRPPFGWYVERRRRPTLPGVRRLLARARPAWEDLARHLSEAYRLDGALHYMYGARFGWAMRFRRGGRLIAAMYPNRNRFTVQIVLGRAQFAAASAIRLAPGVAKVLRRAKDYPEGRWLFIPVKSLTDAQDVKPLVALKLARRPTAASRRA